MDTSPEITSEFPTPLPLPERRSVSASMIQRPKGTQDIYLQDGLQWQALESIVRNRLALSVYSEIRTPIFESTELFQRGVGESTDIVNKEMFTFEKGERSLTLRPEGTAGVVRAVIEQGLHRQPKPLRLFYLGPMFRYERPQEGRQRQFHQLGIELFGADSAALDAEVILMALDVLQALGITNTTLQLNNVGTSESRKQFRESLKALLEPYLPELCEDCQRRYHQNPLRMLDCKNPTCQGIYHQEAVETFLKTYNWDESSQKAFSQLLSILDSLQVDYQVNPYLVRGLDYYTRTVFEISSDQIGAQSTLCGGGRYNQLVQELGGPELSAIGWGMGLERLLMLMPPVEKASLDYYIVTDQLAEAFQLAQRLKEAGKSVELDVSGKNFGKQLAQAAKREAREVIILGETERQQQAVIVKNMAKSEQKEVRLSDFLASFTD